MDEKVPILVTICNVHEGHKYVTIPVDSKLSLPTKATWSTHKLPSHHNLEFTKIYICVGGQTKKIYHACILDGIPKFEKRIQLTQTFYPTTGHFQLKLYDGQHFGLDSDSEDAIKAIHCMYYCKMGILEQRFQ
jgi:hypothetical protein